tara:strand:+ start:162 stop:1427 length:1266 start_codon:yes stop_codon:yes gene_type:complete
MEDTKRLMVIAGAGGNGSVSFLREKFRPNGGPDGGDGGDGGPIILRGRQNLRSLNHLEGVNKIIGEDGLPGKSKQRTGRKGKPSFLDVPLGTVVWSIDLNEEKQRLTEVLEDGEKILIAYGGQGGIGNTHFASSVNQEPLIAIGGEPGEERDIYLEIKLLADVGLVGLPNAGKSSLLNVVTRANSKIGDYPFTTLEPILGVVKVSTGSLVMLDIPGLIENAHLGKGLGLEFLRHCERSAILLQLIDGLSDDFVLDYKTINQELILHNAGLIEKPRFVIVTKADIPEVKERFEAQRELLRAEIGAEPFLLSSATGEGLDDLYHLLDNYTDTSVGEIQPRGLKYIKPLPPVSQRPRVTKDESGFIVTCPPADRILATINLNNWRARLQFHNHLKKMGVMEALIRAKIEEGDTVFLGGYEFTWE